MSEVTEITEDIEVIGPGRLLSDARQAKGLTIEQVAEKLNFRKGLVIDIEADQFDRTLPSTFNRGYLKNYAKLVEVPEEDVLSSYEMLGVAEKQSTEMQSFSKITKKQAQNRSLMWLSYLILAVLIGSTLVWFYQYQSSIEAKSVVLEPKLADSTNDNSSQAQQLKESAKQAEDGTELTPSTSVTEPAKEASEQTSQAIEQGTIEQQQSVEASTDTVVGQTPENTAEIEQTLEIDQADTTGTEATAIVEDVAIFTFSGDCWVNIYDATGERVAWGVKKTDYVMTIKGRAPFNVTLGKPELVTIEFAGQAVDMSRFNAGNIAKFTLPLEQN
ncbi:DUF4115 domain-containing protein [Thalassotalea sp. LPB0316]|uniref:RodZ domain-containing protein n=1 Tax=Thalassotalea sp. LPB0316 TaxID=2769490 RepID=UPI001867710C|nr:RodZ domain-containing protein [Thalassotalea sp. LPB0316]QOL26977.1 DUF4115 domain-containing protein [Thalassotalea sp. LPB0316]